MKLETCPVGIHWNGDMQLGLETYIVYIRVAACRVEIRMYVNGTGNRISHTHIRTRG